MNDVKQVKVDNWGIYFLQRLKHFFNRTDYCDLTLQFQDNAQLKVHRLVLNACTEYFEILERTCEMYEDCLVMPDDLQADVVVPIVNFMYTGQLEFKMDLLEKLYQTSLIMNMPVLTKLLDSHRKKLTSTNLFGKRYSRNVDTPKQSAITSTPINSQPKKRSYTKAFESITEPQSNKKAHLVTKPDPICNNGLFSADTIPTAKNVIKDPKPTRYELPAELDDDNLFDNSFTSISYTSKPLMVHPETTKYYSPKKTRIFDEPSGSKRFLSGTSTIDIVECRKISSNDMFGDDLNDSMLDNEQSCIKEKKDASQLFDQILVSDSGPKVSIETKDSKQASNIDHAKIISEVLKKYPHLVKSNKDIKLKILNTPSKSKKVESKTVKQTNNKAPYVPYGYGTLKSEMPDFTYETDVVDSIEAARLIALGAENIKGPWICLICGTPGRALHFTTYYNYRRHLVEVHNEKPVSNICEHCGLKSLKRNYLLHHMYTKHGVEPPPNFHFPKCNICSYIALTDAFLLKHKLSHTENQHFRCTVCAASFYTSKLLLQHIQKTGHKYSGEKKPTPQCFYCFKYFSRDSNLYAHLKIHHYQLAKTDGIIEDSDDEKTYTHKMSSENFKHESSSKYIEVEIPYENQYENTSFQLEQNADGNIEITKKKPRRLTQISKNKILNAGFSNTSPSNESEGKQQKVSIVRNVVTKSDFIRSPVTTKKDEILLIENNEFVLPDFQLTKHERSGDNFLTNAYQTEVVEALPTITTETNYSNVQNNSDQAKVILKKSNSIHQPIQIVVSNEEEYKALLSSNHSIIFDTGESEKSMTVLSAPTTVENTIDLNNTQTSDMMIIRENYPINITESNTVDNSNIVVVYSHPVDDPSKHYQLITTTQSMEEQFVQSSAIITQNYETVTTTTALMESQEVNTTIANTWQHDMQQNANPIIKASEIQLISNSDAIVTHQDNSITLSQLPEVQLKQQEVEEVHIPEQLPNSEITVVTQNNEHTEANMPVLTDVLPVTTFEAATLIPINTVSTVTMSSTNEPIIEETYKEELSNVEQEQVLIRDTNTDQQTEVSIEECSNTDISMEQVEPDTQIRPSDINEAHVHKLQETNIEENNVRNEVVMEVEEIEEDSQSVQDQLNGNTDIVQDVQMDQIEEDNKVDDEETIENIARDIGVDPNTLIPTENMELPANNEKPIIKEIANLTSEWSEDEGDGVTESIETASQPTTAVLTDEPVMPSNIDTPEDKETKENTEGNVTTEPEIKEEITSEYETNKDLPIVEEIKHEHEQNTEPPTVIENKNQVPTVPQEKISSLLNEWEDNDSQDENNGEDISGNPAEEEKTISATNEVIENNAEPPKVDPKPDISNLVSDWDEDEEEENKG